MNISNYYTEYLEFMDDKVRDQFQTEPESKNREYSFSKEFLSAKQGKIHTPIYEQLKAELLGAGPIESLLGDMAITEIIINAHDEIYYEKRGQLHKFERGYSCQASYHNTIERICHEAGVELNSTRPHCDGLWRGFRLHMLGMPLAKGNTKITLRRNSQNNWSLEKLVAANWCTVQESEWLKKLITDRSNVLVIGPTNTGKTTCINACLQTIDDNERVLFIEDTDELALPNKASVKLLTRQVTDSQAKAYTQQDLLHQCLRMRPDRIVVGEVRGPEAKDYLMSLATGHGGSWCSLHAQCPRQALSRLELLIQMAEPQWKSQSVRQLISLGIDAIVTLENQNGKRKLKNIHLMASLEETGFCLEEMGLEY